METVTARTNTPPLRPSRSHCRQTTRGRQWQWFSTGERTCPAPGGSRVQADAGHQSRTAPASTQANLCFAGVAVEKAAARRYGADGAPLKMRLKSRLAAGGAKATAGASRRGPSDRRRREQQAGSPDTRPRSLGGGAGGGRELAGAAALRPWRGCQQVRGDAANEPALPCMEERQRGDRGAASG